MRSARSVSAAKVPVLGERVRSRVRGLLAAGVAALLAHGLALSGLGWVWPRPDVAPAAPAAMRVRAVGAASRPPAGADAGPARDGAPVVDAAADVAPAQAPAPAQALPQAPARVTRPAHARAVSTAKVPVPVAVAAEVAAPVLTTPPAATNAALAADEAPPTYRTLIPPAATLRYRLARGSASGTGELVWQPQGHRYALHFAGHLDGASALAQASEGEFDAAGVAPRRFVERRARRAAAAANFQREAGRITFSGKAPDAPLHAGSQDRLSWMLQLAAIVAADPALRQDGARVLINVASAGGEVAVWAFRCRGEAVVEPATGTEGTVAFLREGRSPYDTRAEVWLDPARGYLPARATWQSGAADAGYDLQVEASPSDTGRP